MSLPTVPTTWAPIESAPKDGSPIIGASFGRYGGLWIVWWQPEFDAWISGARMMVMAEGYLVDGKPSMLHSPDIQHPSHWIPFPPAPAT